jgi:hypothetical protein
MGDPTWHILALLAVSVGLPYFAVATTSPLLQAWFSRTHPGRRAYRLYALSNVGSLLALLTFPFVIEPLMSSPVQAKVWSCGFVLFAGLAAFCALRTWSVAPAAESPATEPVPDSASGAPSAATPPDTEHGPGLTRRLLWLALPACGSVMLLAVTNQMCQDVAVVPFLWILPLSLYLLTFVICFESERLYVRPFFWLWLVGSTVGMVWLLHKGVYASIVHQVVGYSLGLFGCCMVCHGELVRLKPSPRYLTSFYLTVSAGGALGGIFVSLLAPVIFSACFELHYGLWASCALATIAFWVDVKPHRFWPRSWLLRFVAPFFAVAPFAVLAFHPPSWRKKLDEPDALLWVLALGGLCVLLLLGGLLVVMRSRTRVRPWTWLAALLLPACIVSLGALGRSLYQEARGTLTDSTSISRNFYGVLRVTRYGAGDPNEDRLLLRHGRITHGCQLLSPAGSRRPIMYFSETSGVGLTLLHHPRRRQGLHVGVIGLGAGTLAAYGRPGDRYRFYEINPEVEHLATTTFTYLRNTRADWQIVMGDARLSMESELREGERHPFDVFVLDAFSGDAIPAHLLTREAFEIYLAHLRPDGIIAVHISNRFVNLEPVCLALADHFGLRDAVIEARGDDRRFLSNSIWVLLTRNVAFLNQAAIAQATIPIPPAERRTLLWTDAHSDLLRVLRY